MHKLERGDPDVEESGQRENVTTKALLSKNEKIANDSAK